MATTGRMAPQQNSKSPTIRRILREAAEMSKSPSGDYTAEPLETDLFEWHFTLRGPPNSVYSEGFYHGRIVLPPTYPLRPPSFRFMTPNGRFEANREICLSISGHHEETWQPAWGIRTAIVALRSFMETDARGQLGGLDTTDEVRRRLARESRFYKCPTCARSNIDIICESEKQAAASLSSECPDVQIPSELSMGWKDEMAARAKADESGSSPAGQGQASQDGIVESAQLAEGFVPSGPAEPQPPGAPRLLPPTTDAPSASSDGSIAPVAGAEETTGRETTFQQQLRIRQPTTQQVRGEGAVPLWIDRAIVALVIALAALLVRVLFGI
ncbi:hypothetical protein E4U42_005171 [Claviceps africana]|uniref:UBC core domain-containing protein n=1 Tax=Claviceps africana TaxID=83212 RepID=A0A8K0NKJ8_9HYPO|nr:hypothetical protein E4U42_005171 [Claviceps africana]